MAKLTGTDRSLALGGVATCVNPHVALPQLGVASALALGALALLVLAPGALAPDNKPIVC